MYIKVYIICEQLEKYNTFNIDFIWKYLFFKVYVYNHVMNHFLPIIVIINLPLTLCLSSVIHSLTLSSTSIL